MKQLKRIPLKAWIISLCFWVSPILIEAFTLLDDRYPVLEMIWALILVPTVIFSYYKGLMGGLLVFCISTFINYVWEGVEAALTNDLLDVNDYIIIGVVTFTNLIMTISIGIMADKLMENHAKLQQLSMTDDLTGVLNRRGFLNYSKQAYSEFPNSILLFLDLDGFKCINDRFSHDVGDTLLQATTFRLNRCLNQNDVIGRLGGDEFVCLITNISEEHINRVVHRIQTSLSEPVAFSEESITITPSIGIAIPDEGDSIETLVKKADQAMYEAKQAGKNTFRFFRNT